MRKMDRARNDNSTLRRQVRHMTRSARDVRGIREKAAPELSEEERLGTPIVELARIVARKATTNG